MNELTENLVGSIIKTKYYSYLKYAEIVAVERKPGLQRIFIIKYKFLDKNIKGIYKLDATVYDDKLSHMKLNGGKGGNWVIESPLEIVKKIKSFQPSLF